MREFPASDIQRYLPYRRPEVQLFSYGKARVLMTLFYTSAQHIGNFGDGNKCIFVDIRDNAFEPCNLEAIDNKIYNGSFLTGIKTTCINMCNTRAKRIG